mgnify:CR=1 FL=1|jgi:hypothetical protein
MLTYYNAVLIPARLFEGKLFTQVFCCSTKIHSFKDMYHLIGCDTIEHISVMIDHNHYDVWLDELGKVNHRPACVRVEQYNDVLVGNIIITKGGDEYECFTDEELVAIQQWVYNARLDLYNRIQAYM